MTFLTSIRQLPKDFWLLCVATTLFYSATHVLTTMLPIYIVYLQFGEDTSGQLLALFLLVSVVTRPWVGKFYEEKSPNLLFRIGIMSFIVGNAVMLALPASLVGLIIARVFQGIGFSIFNSTSYSFLAETVPDNARARGIAVFSNSVKMAMAYAPAIGWMLASRGWFLPTIWVSLGFITLSFFTIIKIKSMYSHGHHEEEKLIANKRCVAMPDEIEASITPKGRLFNKKAVFPGLLIASNSVVFGALIPFVPLFVASKGISHVEGFHLCYALALIGSRFIGGEASDKHGRTFTIIPGMAVVLLSLVGMVYSTNTWQFLGSAIGYGLGAGVVQPSIVAMVADRTNKSERGSAMATYTMLADFGQAMGMLMMGYMGHHFSFSLGLGVAAMVNTVGLMLAISIPFRAWLNRRSAPTAL